MAKKKKGQQGGDTLVNLPAQQLAAQVANWAAQLEFSKERFRLLEMPEFQQTVGLQGEELRLKADEFAWQKAEDTWKRAFQESSITGMYNGQPTQEWLMNQAKLTGVLNGQQTLEGKLTDAQIAQMNNAMKLQNDEFLARTTGYYGGAKTFEREQFEQEQGLEGLKLLASLQGPGNAFKQLRVLGNMGNLRDLSNAWMGKYTLSGATGSGQNPGQAQISDLMLGAPGQPGAPSGAGFGWGTMPFSTLPAAGPMMPPGTPLAATPDPYSATPNPYMTSPVPGYTYSPAGVQAPVGAWNYTPTPGGDTQVYPPGIVSPAATPDYSTSTPVAPSAIGGAYNPYAAGVQGTGALLPNQINAENYENTNVYAQKLGWAAMEDQGWDVEAAQDAFQKSLPKYGGPEQGVFKGF